MTETYTAAPQPLLARALKALDDERLLWCVLWGHTGASFRRGRVDVLVWARDRSRVHHALRTAGFVPVDAEPGADVFVSYDAEGDRWLTIGVTVDLAFGPGRTLRTAAGPACLVRRRRVGGLWVLNAGDEFWALYLRWVVDGQGITSADRARLADLAARARPDGPAAAFVDGLQVEDCNAGVILGRARDGDWEALEQLGARLLTAWTRRSSPAATLFRGLRWRRPRPRKPRGGGLGIALVGADGAGKSSVAAALARSMELPVVCVYMGLHQQGHRRLPRVPGLTLPLLMWVRWSRWAKGRLHQARGRVVIFDRYAVDALLPPSRPMTAYRRGRRWLLAHACPRPNLLILLDAPGDVLAARKGGDRAALERRRRDYLALRDRLPEMIVLDARRGVDDLCRELTAFVWQCSARARRR